MTQTTDKPSRLEVAEAFLAENECWQAWDLGNRPVDDWPPHHKGDRDTLMDLVTKCASFGTLSEKQLELAKNLIERINSYADRQAEEEQRKANADSVPDGGRHIVSARVIRAKWKMTAWGDKLCLTVEENDRGFRLYGSCPSKLVTIQGANGALREIGHGDEIAFEAELVPSKDDPKFGFYRRPNNAVLVQSN